MDKLHIPSKISTNDHLKDKPQDLPPPSSESSLNFWKDYLVQTRKEVDLEKTEVTRILHLKIIMLGALFILVRGAVGLLAILVLPLAMYALDMMQQSRFQYIIHRWEYLELHVLPRLRELLTFDNNHFFEQDVMERYHNQYYIPREAQIRTVLFIPALCASSIAAGSIVSIFFDATENYFYTTSILWLSIISFIVTREPEVYLRRSILIISILFGILFMLDWFILDGIGFIKVIELVI